jgi:hypothetical protein
MSFLTEVVFKLYLNLRMDNEQILELFGKILISKTYDKSARFLKSDLKDLKQTDRYKNLFSEMTQVQKTELEKLSKEMLSGILFDFLKIFEENREFKLIYEAEGKRVDLVQISEMLKAEPIIEGGWIDRFSMYSDNGNSV